MNAVAVRLLHVEAAADAGPLERGLAAVRAAMAERLADQFRQAGAADVAVRSGPPDDTPFGRRVRDLVAREQPAGIVIAGSGALALARAADLAAFLATAAADRRVALANNRYSADVVGIACAAALRDVPDLRGDNALPRWLEESAGYVVRDLRSRRRLQVDVDGPLDARLAGVAWPEPRDTDAVDARIARLAKVGADRAAEVVVAGRTSAGTVRWLEEHLAARVRALVEERGLRASGAGNRRPPRSVLGLLLERDGPGALGDVLAELGDAALVDSRVLLAHRLGPDERSWPALEDRLASDLLLADAVSDPWLRSLTASAAGARIPVLLGGHTLVGPGLPLVFGAPR
ncbi:MAG TPA: hypothetical protein VM344_07220 [Vitreimonas sp.]|nr:hypothetical protein [Vitreimonas sp.]